MLYAKVDASGNVLQWPIRETELREMFPNVAFPKTITEEALAGLNIVMVPPEAVPSTLQETKTQRVQMSPTLTLVNGKYTRQYELAPVHTAELDRRTSRKWTQIRERRDTLMNEFEWRIARYHREVRMGMTPKDNIATLDAYMQALADITLQADPFQITWPQVPV